MALWVYIFFGPAPWVLFVLSTAMAYVRMSRLRRPPRPLPSTPPHVTVLIPAKDEGEGVRACLDQVLALHYPRFNVIAIDDRSNDSTGAVFDEYAARSAGKLTAVHIHELPSGWLGKCNALATAAANLEADWILFVDFDVKVEPDALRAVLALAVERNYDAVSFMTRLECHSFWERLLLPLCAASVGAMTLMSYTNNDNRKSMAFANGQFMLVRRSAYEAAGGHGAVRDRITEDVALVRLMKARDFRVRLYFGRDFASTRMHTTLSQMFNGWARIFSGVSDRRPWAILLAICLVLSGLSAYLAAACAVWIFAFHHDPPWLIAAATHLVALHSALVIIYHFSGNARRCALAFPMGGVMLLAIYAYALRACRTGKIAWRGTHYAASARSV